MHQGRCTMFAAFTSEDSQSAWHNLAQPASPRVIGQTTHTEGCQALHAEATVALWAYLFIPFDIRNVLEEGDDH